MISRIFPLSTLAAVAVCTALASYAGAGLSSFGHPGDLVIVKVSDRPSQQPLHYPAHLESSDVVRSLPVCVSGTRPWRIEKNRTPGKSSVRVEYVESDGTHVVVHHRGPSLCQLAEAGVE